MFTFRTIRAKKSCPWNSSHLITGALQFLETSITEPCTLAAGTTENHSYYQWIARDIRIREFYSLPTNMFSIAWFESLYIICDHRGTNFLTTVRVNGEKVTQPKVKTIALIWPRALTWSINTCYILHILILVKLNQIIACMFQKYIFYGNEAGNYFLSWRNSLSNSEFQLC